MLKLLKILGYIFAFIFFKRLIGSLLAPQSSHPPQTNPKRPEDPSVIEAQFKKID